MRRCTTTARADRWERHAHPAQARQWRADAPRSRSSRRWPGHVSAGFRPAAAFLRGRAGGEVPAERVPGHDARRQERDLLQSQPAERRAGRQHAGDQDDRGRRCGRHVIPRRLDAVQLRLRRDARGGLQGPDAAIGFRPPHRRPDRLLRRDRWRLHRPPERAGLHLADRHEAALIPDLRHHPAQARAGPVRWPGKRRRAGRLPVRRTGSGSALQRAEATRVTGGLARAANGDAGRVLPGGQHVLGGPGDWRRA